MKEHRLLLRQPFENELAKEPRASHMALDDRTGPTEAGVGVSGEEINLDVELKKNLRDAGNTARSILENML